jgi:hypothetical protein
MVQVTIMQGESQYRPLLLELIDEKLLCEEYGGTAKSLRPLSTGGKVAAR